MQQQPSALVFSCLLLLELISCFLNQVDAAKKSLEETKLSFEDMEIAKKKMQRECEGLLQREEDLMAENSRLEKSRKKMQDEVRKNRVC